MESGNNNTVVENELAGKCYECKEVLTADEVTENNKNSTGKTICEKCFDTKYFVCSDCGHVESVSELTWIAGDQYCDSCRYNDHFRCNNCDNWFHTDDHNEDDNGNSYCESCRDNGSGEFESDDDDNENLIKREITMTKKYQSKDYGNIIKSKRGFAVEVECYASQDGNGYGDHNELVRDDLPDELGISSDGSLGANGVEFQTPILKGAKGEQFIKDFCNTLVKNNYYVDKSCGLHLHIDGGKDFTIAGLRNSSKLYKRLDNFKRLFASYYILDDILANFLPLSRRENNYCKILRNDYNLAEVMNVTTQEKFEKIWYRCDDLRIIDDMKKHKCNDTRYHGINMHCLLWQNHLEVRYHSGTIDKYKILFWTELNLAIVAYATSKSFSIENLKKLQAIVNPATRRAEMYKLLGLEGDIIGYFEARAKKFCNDELTSNVTENK